MRGFNRILEKADTSISLLGVDNDLEGNMYACGFNWRYRICGTKCATAANVFPYYDILYTGW